MEKDTLKNVLSIAGVDPSGGAGVFADIKVMSALGTYGMGVVAALTAQNTRAVTGVMPVPAAFVTEQIDTLFADVRVDAVKIGMLGAVDVMDAVAAGLERHRPQRVVLDTVMVAKSGDRLMPDDAVAFFRRRLLPLAGLITPNLPEAEVLLEEKICGIDAMYGAAEKLYALSGSRAAVYMKGGHMAGGTVTDIVFDGKDMMTMTAPRVDTKNTHGTGCSLSSALAALWAKTGDLKAAARAAHDYLAEAIAASGALDVGGGHGPIHHFVRVNCH